MAIIKWKKDQTVAIISMCNGANKQNLDFVNTMNQCFDEILTDTEVSSIILTY